MKKKMIPMDAEREFRRMIDPRRRQEVSDSRLMFEDHNAVSNLPEKCINKQWDPNRWVEAFKPGYDEITGE